MFFIKKFSKLFALAAFAPVFGTCNSESGFEWKFINNSVVEIEIESADLSTNKFTLGAGETRTETSQTSVINFIRSSPYYDDGNDFKAQVTATQTTGKREVTFKDTGVSTLTDTRWNGVFKSDDGSFRLTANGTNKITTSSGADKFIWRIEIDTDKTHYRRALWNDSSTQTAWYDYFFIDGNTLEIIWDSTMFTLKK